ncbi:MAG: exodeoxyribonuclease-1 [Flavobacteriales bacterium]|jgi:exodeoxyribonuclease-1
MKTFYWHDYETWGVNPAVDRPSQFAGVRTDENLNIVGEPLMIYCKPPIDVLPNPEACLVTGLSPQVALSRGLDECEFIRKIHSEMSQAHTCSVGYNTVRFDDEVTRYTLYRNFYDPYEREWKNGNSRWDIIDMVRMVYALRPEGIEWPMINDRPSFKLENLTKANGIEHGAAHDAFSDVEATINLAKLIKAKQPRLYDFVYNSRSKKVVSQNIDIRSRKPMLHISSKFSSEHGCAGLIVPLAAHPVNANAVIVYELSQDPSPLLHLTIEQIQERVFTRAVDLPEGMERLPLKLIHINKCPILAPANSLDSAAARRLGIDKDQCEKHWQALLTMDLEFKMREVFQPQSYPDKTDPEQALYSGFLNHADKQLSREFRATLGSELAERNFVFEDARLNEISFRYRARNFPGSLNDRERAQWREFVSARLRNGEDGLLSLTIFRQKLAALVDDCHERNTMEHLGLLAQLQKYADDLERQY